MSVVRKCRINEDGSPQTLEEGVLEILSDWSARDALFAAPGLVGLFWRHDWDETVANLAQSLVAIVDDACFNVAEGEWVTPEKLDEFIDTWHRALVDQTTGHTHEAFTRGEHDTDELLGPILTLPGEQMVTLAEKLAARLEADERVPYLVWSAFKRMVMPLVLNRPAGEVIQLKTALATEIAELIEHKLPRADLVGAMAAALAWRGLEQLTQVKTAIVAGGRPRVTGRQSCLFLDVQDVDENLVATVIL